MTNVQKQCLLCYLGFYTAEVDGLWGPASKAATSAFQRAYGLQEDGIAGEETEEALKYAVANGMPAKKDFWAEIKYFKRDEFRCTCGGKYCDGFPAEPSEKLVRLADRVREHFGAPAIISSGVRCETRNAVVGGVSGSRHKFGTAIDFQISGMSASMVLPYVQAQPETNYAYDIDGTYIHMDVL